MKKILFVVLALLLAASICYAMMDAAVSVSGTTSYQKVTVEKNTSTCRPVSVWTLTGVGFCIAQDASGTGVKCLPSDNAYNNSCMRIDQDGTIFWIKVATGTDTIYVDVGRAQ